MTGRKVCVGLEPVLRQSRFSINIIQRLNTHPAESFDGMTADMRVFGDSQNRPDFGQIAGNDEAAGDRGILPILPMAVRTRVVTGGEFRTVVFPGSVVLGQSFWPFRELAPRHSSAITRQSDAGRADRIVCGSLKGLVPLASMGDRIAIRAFRGARVGMIPSMAIVRCTIRGGEVNPTATLCQGRMPSIPANHRVESGHRPVHCHSETHAARQ